MLKVEEYAKIRLAHQGGMSIRALAREYRHSRYKIREILKNPAPQPYQRAQSHQPKLTVAFRKQIDDILKEDESAPRKQRHTAQAIFLGIQQDGYAGGYDQVRRYVKQQRVSQRETFIPLSHDPGQRAEADFGKIYVDFPDGRRQVSVLLITWAYSNCVFAVALPNEKIESILAGTVQAFEFFGCVPRELWWDNPKTVVSQIREGRKRTMNARYMTLVSHYKFEPLFCLPARGNEKPHVENRVKHMQRTWATPVPKARDLDELNRYLRQCCVNDQARTVSGKEESIAARFTQDRQQALPLPDHAFDPAVTHERAIDKYQTVAFDHVRYSVPRSCAFQKATVKAYVDRIEIVANGKVIATHIRSYDSGTMVLDPLHYLEALTKKPAALDHAPVFKNWKLPKGITDLRSYFESRHGTTPGARQFIRVLKLLSSYSIDQVKKAVQQCQTEGVVTAERICFRCEQIAKDTAKQSVDELVDKTLSQKVSLVPTVQVPVPDLNKFDSFLSQGGDAHDHARPTTLTQGQSETTATANHACRVFEAGT